jgi:nucleoside-diphosphate-sugar epimerase
MKLPADKLAPLKQFYADRPVLVTGGAGFIGGHLVDALQFLRARITVIDDLSNSTLDHLGACIEMEPDRVNFVNGSVLDDAAMVDAAEGAKTVFHLAALGSVPRSVKNPQRTWSVNATGTVRVLEAARAAGAERVVLAASSSAYGNNPALPRVETQTPQPESPYAASKLAGEVLLSVWAQCYGLSTVSLRYFNIFGPRQSADSAYAAVVAAFARRLLAGESPVIYGDGSQSRDFTYVGDAVLATLLAGASPRRLAGEVMNIGVGRRTTIAELAGIMAEGCAVPHVRPVFEAKRDGDVMHSHADIGRARELLGYEPTHTLEAGLAETLKWYREAMAGA